MRNVVYEFGGFRLDPARRSVMNGRGMPVALPPPAFEALLLLVEKHGTLVDRSTLTRAIWPRTTVTGNSLDQLISRLRLALESGERARSPISTERGRGYRFVDEVKELPGAGATNEASFIGQTGNHARRLDVQARALSIRPSTENILAGYELVQAAVARDPRDARALAHLALLDTIRLAFDFSASGALDAAEERARRALEIDPGVARGHQALGNVLVMRGHWNEAADHFETACRLEEEPDARATRVWQLTQSVGHLELALRQATAIDPAELSQPLGLIGASSSCLFMGRDRQAREFTDAAAALGWPRSQPVLREAYSLLALRAGSYREADDILMLGLPEPMRAAGAAEAIALLCDALRSPAKRGEAIAALRGSIARLAPASFGMVDRKRVLLWLVMLGALDEAFELADASLDHFARSGMIGMAWGLLWMPEMLPFRDDARFGHIVTRLRLRDYWERHGPPDGYTGRRVAELVLRSEPHRP